MELIYNITRKCNPNRDWKADDPALCRISSHNIIAFCSTMELDTEAPCGHQNIGSMYHVYVCDIDKPWQVHLVVSCKTQVVSLEWHISGTKLLIASSLGKVQIWQMQKFLLNKWMMEASGDLPGEEIVALAWFQPGAKTVFNGDARDSSQYLEKVTKTRCTPTLCQYGGKPMNGWVAVTVSGMVAVGLPTPSSKDMQVKMESLTPGRVRLNLVDIAFNPNGTLGIVTSDGQIASAIQCYLVKVATNQHHDDEAAITLTCHAAPSFYAKCHRDASLHDSLTARITHVRYMQHDGGCDVLMVAAGDSTTSQIELWHTVSECVPLHRVYQLQQPSSPMMETCLRQTWAFQSSIQHGSLPLSIAVPKFPIRYKQTDASQQMFQYVAVAYKDGSVKLINKNSFQPMATTNLDMGWSDAGPEKRRRVIAHLSVMEQTLTGCALVGIDQLGTMYAMKVVNTRDPVTHVQPTYLLAMLEYCIVAGFDWWDVLAALKHNALELCDHLRENLRQQAPVIQELYLSRYLAVTASLYCCAGLAPKAADTHCRLVLHSIRAHFNIILRPKGLSAGEMGPIEKLSMACQQTAEPDLDKVVVALSPDRMDFAVDSGSLQALQPLLQWVADVSLYLMAALPPNTSGSGSFPGASLLHDASFISMLRELLVVTYFWGMITPSCLPHLSQRDLQRLFSLVTQVWLKAKENSMSYDDGLLDECAALGTHLPVPQMDQGMFGGHFASTLIFSQPLPVKFSYGEEPAYVKNRPLVPSVLFSPDRQPPANQIKDVVRLIHLGVTAPDDVKICSRCRCLTLMDYSISTKLAATGSWEGKWVRQCLCGGMWMYGFV